MEMLRVNLQKMQLRRCKNKKKKIIKIKSRIKTQEEESDWAIEEARNKLKEESTDQTFTRKLSQQESLSHQVLVLEAMMKKT